MPMHPLPILMNQGIHVALSNDDPGMFGYMGLSFDFFQVGGLSWLARWTRLTPE